MTGVEVTLTDSEGNVLKETSQNTTTFSAYRYRCNKRIYTESSQRWLLCN